MTKHIDEWVILAGLLFTATAAFVAAEIQIFILTLSGQFGTIPPSQTVGSDVSTITSTPVFPLVLPRVFFSYLYILSAWCWPI